MRKDKKRWRRRKFSNITQPPCCRVHTPQHRKDHGRTLPCRHRKQCLKVGRYIMTCLKGTNQSFLFLNNIYIYQKVKSFSSQLDNYLKINLKIQKKNFNAGLKYFTFKSNLIFTPCFLNINKLNYLLSISSEKWFLRVIEYLYCIFKLEKDQFILAHDDK
jgi:hypothetical protein